MKALKLGSQFDKVFVPYPANCLLRVVLVFGKPKFAFFSNDIKDLGKAIISSLIDPFDVKGFVPLRPDKSSKDNLLLF